MERMDALLYDCDIREPLFDYLEERFGKARMFEEKMIGKSRADVLMVTESRITGLEIKSDADTYERLKRQIRDYDKYCDDNYVVIGRSHAKHVEEHIPAYWGGSGRLCERQEYYDRGNAASTAESENEAGTAACHSMEGRAPEYY